MRYADGARGCPTRAKVPPAPLPMKKHCPDRRSRPQSRIGCAMMDTLLPLLIGLFWGLALAGLLTVWTTEAILAVWAAEDRDEQHWPPSTD